MPNLIVIDESQASIKMLLHCLRKKANAANAAEADNLSVTRSYRFHDNHTFLLRIETRDVDTEDKFTAMMILKFCDAQSSNFIAHD